MCVGSSLSLYHLHGKANFLDVLEGIVCCVFRESHKDLCPFQTKKRNTSPSLFLDGEAFFKPFQRISEVGYVFCYDSVVTTDVGDQHSACSVHYLERIAQTELFAQCEVDDRGGYKPGIVSCRVGRDERC